MVVMAKKCECSVFWVAFESSPDAPRLFFSHLFFIDFLCAYGMQMKPVNNSLKSEPKPIEFLEIRMMDAFLHLLGGLQ